MLGSGSSRPSSAGGVRDQPSDRNGCLLCRWDARWDVRWSLDRYRSFAGSDGSAQTVRGFEAGSSAAVCSPVG